MKFLDSRLRGNDTRGMYTWPLWISEFFFISDCAQLLKGIIINAKRQWEMTQEKIRISRMLANISPFVPASVRNIVDKNPEMLTQEKKRKEVSVLFLDLEGYTKLN